MHACLTYLQYHKSQPNNLSKINENYFGVLKEILKALFLQLASVKATSLEKVNSEVDGLLLGIKHVVKVARKYIA